MIFLIAFPIKSQIVYVLLFLFNGNRLPDHIIFPLFFCDSIFSFPSLLNIITFHTINLIPWEMCIWPWTLTLQHRQSGSVNDILARRNLFNDCVETILSIIWTFWAIKLKWSKCVNKRDTVLCICVELKPLYFATQESLIHSEWSRS